MRQLIIDGMPLPESQKGGYTVGVEDLSVDIKMISGRLVRELRGAAYTIAYQYGFFDDAEKNQLLSILEKGRRQPITCGFILPDCNDDTEELVFSEFLVTKIKQPVFKWSRLTDLESGGTVAKPVWADFSFELREVNPHD